MMLKKYGRLILLYLAVIAGLLWLHHPLSNDPENKPKASTNFIYQQF